MKELLHSLSLGTNVAAVLIAIATFCILYLMQIENWVGVSFSVLSGLAAGVVIARLQSIIQAIAISLRRR